MLRGMNLTWYGQATFYVEATDGTVIVTDPYNFETSGYAPLEKEADVVVISSATDDFHNNAHLVAGDPSVVNALTVAQSGEPHTEKGITFHAVEAMENVFAPRGAPRPERDVPLYG